MSSILRDARSPKSGATGSDTPGSPGSAMPSFGRDDIEHLLETLPDGVIFLDREWRITYANQSARRISRIEPHYINGASHWDLYPATVGTGQEQIYRRTMEERIALEQESYYAPFDIWISLRTLPIPTGIAVLYQDVTRLRRAEAMNFETGRQLQQVFDSTKDGICVLDRDYNFRFLNRRARELIAPSRDVLGKNLWTSFPAANYEGSPFVETYREAMEQGKSGSFEAYYPEPLNLWLSVEAHAAPDGIIVFFRDITQQREDAEALRRKSEEMERQAAEIETVYRTAPIGLALFDTEDFRYLRLNERQAAFFGLKPQDVEGRTLTEMAPIPGLRELFEQVREGKHVVNYPLEGELISHPGEHRYWMVNYSPVYGPDGSVQAISAASLEITQQRRAEQALLQSEKLAAVGRLASSIAHEINNPLEAVTNLLYLMEIHDGVPVVVQEYVQMAQAELVRVSQIATQTLRFYRQAARPTLVTAGQVVEPVVNLFQRRIGNGGLEVRMRISTEVQFSCLEGEIRQVLSNLVGNAIDAMRRGGVLSLRAHDATDFATGCKGVRITVADTGSGMSKETLARVFEPFFTTKDLNGTGLGLWISAEIVARHKGRLRVRSSENPRRHGTVFGLFLPLG
jgi:PAS domain S-box-containing protein